jgi:prephenate dehydrogenase
MSDFTVTIVGTGVIGTSLGLVLKQLKDSPRVLAHDKELSNAQNGVKMGAFDKAEWNLVNACEKADMIMLAIPLDGIHSTLKAIAGDLKEGVVITDTCRSKASVLAWADELLPNHAHFVGGNPIVNTAASGHSHARADLFKDRLYCITPALKANESAVQLVVDVVSLVGAQPFFLDAVEHDALMTAVEHLPTALGVTLVSTLSHQNSWQEIRKVAGPLFEKTTSSVIGETNGVIEDMLANRENLLRWLDSYLGQLNQLRALLADDAGKQALTDMVDQALVERYNWQVDYEQGRFIDPMLEPATVEITGFMKRLLGFRR